MLASNRRLIVHTLCCSRKCAQLVKPDNSAGDGNDNRSRCPSASPPMSPSLPQFKIHIPSNSHRKGTSTCDSIGSIDSMTMGTMQRTSSNLSAPRDLTLSVSSSSSASAEERGITFCGNLCPSCQSVQRGEEAGNQQ